MKFDALNLIPQLLRAVKAEGYETPTPIQAQAIPPILDRKDVLACAQTGTGKTAAFALPILQILAESAQGANPEEAKLPQGPIPRGQSFKAVRAIKVLILTPTRELASQIADSFTTYGKGLAIRNTVIFGGVGQQPQVRAIRQGVDILVATPGRLLDLMDQRLINFDSLEIFVLDEADRMLDMGFIADVKRIIQQIPNQRQTLFFSATMPPIIQKLSDQILFEPVRIEVTPVASTVDKIRQGIYPVAKRQKTALLLHLLEELKVERAIVFTRTKRDANRVTDDLNHAGVRAAAIHGERSQLQREEALESIKKGRSRVLVATDIAARGIDIDNVTHVFNHDIPNEPESYVHRIGRTARAGTEGTALSFCSYEERDFLRDIERLIQKKIEILEAPAGLAEDPARVRPPRNRPKRPKDGGPRPKLGGPKGAPRGGPLSRKLPSATHANPTPSPNNRKQRRKKLLDGKKPAE
ncbi:MAG: DEAD/DEAH box helicase [Methylotenera sp.]|nr:DEAD/DEAH box helicase [Oligoflexia bacterium]